MFFQEAEDDEIMVESSSKRVQQSPVDPSKKPRLLQLRGISRDHPDAQDTTLLKAVNYESIDQIRYNSLDDEEQVNNAVKRYEADLFVPNPNGRPTGFYTEYDIERVRIGGCNPGPGPIAAGPVLEVISVSIYKKNKDNDDYSDNPKWEDFGMFGKIYLTDYLGNTYCIYNSPQDEPDHVFEGGDLFLTKCPIAPVMGPTLKFSLIDVDSLDPVFNENKNYYLDNSLDCGKEVSQEFHGEGDYVARMVYKKTPLAVVVELDLYLNYKPPGYQEGTTYDVSGTIKANNIVCWESSEGEGMTYGKESAFSQSRSVFAVPIETPIEIHISCSSGGRQFNEIFEHPPKYCFDPRGEYYFSNEKGYYFVLEMVSATHDDFFSQGGRGWGYLDREWNAGVPKIYSSIQDRSLEVALVEVFSVTFCGGQSAVAPICGQIVVRNQQEKVYVFARNKKHPDKCLSNEERFRRILSLAWPDKWILEKDFYMHLRLKDDDDEPVCKGYLSWKQYDIRFDRRLCDVILGERGYYVAVHYSVFLNGKKAKVSVNFSSKSGDQDRLVYGSIFAEYGNYDDYHSTYDKACYRIIIFDRSEEDCVNVESVSELPLAKSHVSAPANCNSLSVHVNLCVVSCAPAIDHFVFKAGVDQFESCGKGLGRITLRIQWFP